MSKLGLLYYKDSIVKDFTVLLMLSFWGISTKKVGKTSNRVIIFVCVAECAGGKDSPWNGHGKCEVRIWDVRRRNSCNKQSSPSFDFIPRDIAPTQCKCYSVFCISSLLQHRAMVLERDQANVHVTLDMKESCVMSVPTCSLKRRVKILNLNVLVSQWKLECNYVKFCVTW